MNRSGWVARLAALMAAALLALNMGAALAQEETSVEQWRRLTSALNQADWDMWYRDAANDVPIYRITEQRTVSDQDVAALMAVLEARKALQRWELDNETDEARLALVRESMVEPDEEGARELLLGLMLLWAEADERGITGDEVHELMMRYHRREEWADIVPDGATPSDPDVLVLRGLIRVHSWLNDLVNTTSAPMPFEGSAAQIDDLIETLRAKYPQLEGARSTPETAPTPMPYIELTREVYRLQKQIAERDRSGDTPIYRIDGARFVSREDVEGYLALMRVGAELKRHAGEPDSKIVEPSEAYVEDLLVERMLLEAEAEALGITDEELNGALTYYMQKGYMEEEGTSDPLDVLLTPDASPDTDEVKKQAEARMAAPTPTPYPTHPGTLVRDGWVRNRLAISEMWASQTGKWSFRRNAALMDALIKALKLKYPSTAEEEDNAGVSLGGK